MAMVRHPRTEIAEELRAAAGDDRLSSVVVYDADFPHEVGQQFVEAVLVSAEGVTRSLSLLDPDNQEISELVHEVAHDHGETVKFCIDLD